MAPAPPPTRRRRRKGRTARFLWLASAIFIVYGTSIPFNFSWDAGSAAAKLSEIPFETLRSPGTFLDASIPDTVQNVLLFVPFGAFGMLALRRRYRPVLRVCAVTTAGLCLSVAVELMQLFTTDRTSSVNDLVTNTTGTIVGAAVAPVLLALLRRILVALGARGVVAPRAAYPVLVAMAVLPIAAWHPFDASLDVGVLWPKAKTLAAAPWQFGTIADEPFDFLRYALFGAALVAVFREMRMRRKIMLAFAVATAAALFFEAGQFIIQSRMPGLKDLIVQAAGAGAGALLARHATLLYSPRVAAALIGVAVCAAAAVQMLSPFQWTAVRGGFNWMPFLSYYQYTSGQTVTHVIELMLMFLPFGFVLALAAPRRPTATAVALTFPLALSLEFLQGFVRGRFPDVTDIGITLIGAAAGAWLAGPGWRRFDRELLRATRADGRPPILGPVPPVPVVREPAPRPSSTPWQPRFETVVRPSKSRRD
jgi:glycopeptide antibiotics resistance protein